MELELEEVEPEELELVELELEDDPGPGFKSAEGPEEPEAVEVGGAVSEDGSDSLKSWRSLRLWN